MGNLNLTAHKLKWIGQVFYSAYQEAMERGDGETAYDIHGEFDRVYQFIWHSQQKYSLANTNFSPDELTGLVTLCKNGNVDVELIAPDKMDDNRFIVRMPSGRYGSYLKNSLHVPEELLDRINGFRYGDD